MSKFEEVQKEEIKEVQKIEIESGCFVCHGTGHWARECTSLPSIYLTDDAPKCYRCGGVGHFARFCPTSEKQFKHRERRASMPMMNYSSEYFGDLMNFPIPQIPDQIFLVRPDYDNYSFENIMIDDENELRSDCSSVDYIVEDQDSIDFKPNSSTDTTRTNENMVEVSIDTNQNQK